MLLENGANVDTDDNFSNVYQMATEMQVISVEGINSVAEFFIHP